MRFVGLVHFFVFIQSFRTFKFLQITDRLNCYRIRIIEPYTLLDDLNTFELVLVLKEISDFSLGQITLDQAWHKTVRFAGVQVHLFNDLFHCK
ncbi:hypothetical protein D3C74_331890 [compost metagenome]